MFVGFFFVCVLQNYSGLTAPEKRRRKRKATDGKDFP